MMDQQPVQGGWGAVRRGAVIISIASCCGNQDNLRPGGPWQPKCYDLTLLLPPPPSLSSIKSWHWVGRKIVSSLAFQGLEVKQGMFRDQNHNKCISQRKKNLTTTSFVRWCSYQNLSPSLILNKLSMTILQEKRKIFCCHFQTFRHLRLVHTPSSITIAFQQSAV